jgi:hypothetical protein
MSIKKTNKELSDRDLLLKCVDLVFNKNKLSDQELLLKCVELISNKSKVHHLNDIIVESQKLFDFVKSNDKA